MAARPRVISLVGVAGCGKSTVGPLLAADLACSFVDLDAEIERRAGRAIAAIFAGEGEAAFRRLERQALQDVLRSPAASLVLACGGGVLDTVGNQELLAAAGPVVWLDVPPATAMRRCAGQEGSRPLLQDPAAYRRRLDDRLPRYRAAGLRVPADAAPEEVARRVLGALGPRAS